MGIIVAIIHYLIQVFILLIIASAVLSFFMSPYHPVRQFVDRLVEPLLAPIRRLLPATGPLDFSPIILIVILEILDTVIIRLIR